jgi:hypothetical protein
MMQPSSQTHGGARIATASLSESAATTMSTSDMGPSARAAIEGASATRLQVAWAAFRSAISAPATSSRRGACVPLSAGQIPQMSGIASPSKLADRRPAGLQS